MLHLIIYLLCSGTLDNTSSFRNVHLAGAFTLAKASVGLATQSKYEIAWKYWLKFLSQYYVRPENECSEEHLGLATMPETTVVKLLASWIHYLQHPSGLNLSSEYTSQLMSGLRYQFKLRCIPSEVFANPFLKACKSGLAKDPTKAPTRKRRTLPMSLNMVDAMVNAYNPLTAPLEDGLLGMGVILAFGCLLRPSEFCEGTRTDHAFRADAIEFECTTPGSLQTTMRNAAEIGDTTWEQVNLVKLTMRHAKNIQFRAGKSMWFSVSHQANTPRCQLTEYMFRWAKRAHLQPRERFLSYRASFSGVYRNLSYRRFVKAIKETATRFGFNPTHFAGYSPRVGGASLLRAAGASDGFLKLMGRWKTLPACLGYQETSTKACDLMLLYWTNRTYIPNAIYV